jgi:hypothetical protein
MWRREDGFFSLRWRYQNRHYATIYLKKIRKRSEKHLYSQFSVELADMYMRLYLEKSGLSKDEINQWAPIIAAARLSECVSSEKPKRLLEIVNQFCPI